ncbi:MAG: cysteine desulfurase [Planctomycetota bacterium]|jgi:cysteine desulfurase/selenocysteine lyase|nr:cysteine desulfurase [Planctomycetota bacterium]
MTTNEFPAGAGDWSSLIADLAADRAGELFPTSPAAVPDRETAREFRLDGGELQTIIDRLPADFARTSVPAEASGAIPGHSSAGADPFQNGFRPLVAPLAAAPGGWDAQAIHRDFPILSEKVDGKNLVWLDNGATTQKPRQVIDRLVYFYEHENSNIHRSAHTLAARASDAFEKARGTVAGFIGAPSAENIVFVRGATEGVNLVASACRSRQKPGDEIIVSHLEQHANIVPWQLACQETGAVLKVIPVTDRGELRLDEYGRLLGPRTKMVAVAQVSNVLGAIVPVREIVQAAKRYGALTLIDGAQSAAHLPVNMAELDCDFFVFSGHKVYGPTGIGVLYGRREALEIMPPYQSGGNMIADVTFGRTLYQPPPARFEAGTADIAGAVGLGAALEYLSALGMAAVSLHEAELAAYAGEALRRVNGLRLVGEPPERTGVFSFVIDGVADEAVSGRLRAAGVAVRVGHHCAQPIHRRFSLERSVRASLGVYNTREEIDFLVSLLRNLR